jgi:hypothetical protein
VSTRPSRAGSSPISDSSRRIVSCILAFYLLAAGVLAQPPATDPDALYQQRETRGRAQQAADIWAARTAVKPDDIDSWWKLARACYWIGTEGDDTGRRPALERGVDAGTRAAALAPSRPEGHFWLAANMGALAESFGLTQGLKYRGRIKRELERVLAINPGWQQGSADRALGWWYHRVPGLFGGSESTAEAHLRAALGWNPRSTATLYFLGEVLLERDRDDEARATFRQVMDAPLDPEWAPEDRAFKRKAAERLAALTGRRP